MDATAYILIINTILGFAYDKWSEAKKVHGEKAIPSWEEISAKNAILQAKIDAEKIS